MWSLIPDCNVSDQSLKLNIATWQFLLWQTCLLFPACDPIPLALRQVAWWWCHYKDSFTLQQQQSCRSTAFHTVWDGSNKVLFAICVRLYKIIFEPCQTISAEMQRCNVNTKKSASKDVSSAHITLIITLSANILSIISCCILIGLFVDVGHSSSHIVGLWS